MSNLEPREALDLALEQKPGCGINILFPSYYERERFRWRCYSTMSAEAKTSRRELAPESAGWGKHSWGDVRLVKVSAHSLWIGRKVDKEVIVVEGVPVPPLEKEKE